MTTQPIYKNEDDRTWDDLNTKSKRCKKCMMYFADGTDNSECSFCRHTQKYTPYKIVPKRAHQ